MTRRVPAKLRDVAVLSRDQDAPPPDTIPDERLQLIFTGCHPALPFEARVALTLRTLAGLLPDEAEPRGLLALLLLVECRRAVRVEGGELVTLEHQDRSRWDTALIGEGVVLLDEALVMRRTGPSGALRGDPRQRGAVGRSGDRATTRRSAARGGATRSGLRGDLGSVVRDR